MTTRIVHRHFSTIPSTNSWAKEHFETFDPSVITLITADQQTGGRGRGKRQWSSPPEGNFYGSFCFFLDLHQRDLQALGLITAIAVARGLETFGLAPAIKWPNDVLVGRKKIAGILCETVVTPKNIFVVVGIGINVGMEDTSLAKVGQPATSLKLELEIPPSIKEFTKIFQNIFYLELQQFLEKGFSERFSEFKKRIAHKKNTPIQFHQGEKIWIGVFHSVAADGSLNLLLDDGTVINFLSGDLHE